MIRKSILSDMVKKRSRMGRPPKKKSELLNSRVIVNMTRAERRRLEMEARKAGVSVSVYLLNFWRKGR